MKVNLVVGDWSQDGHNRYETFPMIVTGCDSPEELEAAYQKGCESLGIQSLNQFCAAYEQDEFPAAIYLRVLGMAEAKGLDLYFLDNTLDGETYGMCPEEYALAYMFIATLGNEGIDFSIPPPKKEAELNIGGYGLFYG